MEMSESDDDGYFLKTIKEKLVDFIERNKRAENENPPFDKKRKFDYLFVSKLRTGEYCVLNHSRTNR